MLRYNILTLLLTMISLTSFGQNNDVWTAFWNSDTTLVGFKDKHGEIKIAPRFAGITIAEKFENIIAAIEEINDTWSNYYLTKSGKKVGKDSLHIFDNGVDCESEGFIRFRDHKTDKAGMLNRNGDIVIPAEYNDLTRVMNGVFVGLKGAEKKYWDETHAGCEHFSWTGGEEVVVDTLNNVIIENFAYDSNLSFFTLKKSDTPSSDTIRKSFLAKDGSYYSFVDFEKEFRQWLVNELLISMTSEKLINSSYDTITWWSSTDWAKTDRRKFVTDNFPVLRNGLSEILNPQCDFFILNQGLNPYMYESEEFKQYFNNCSEAKDWIYPVMVIVISHKSNKDFSQDHYEFLWTDNGYKLISVSIRGEEIK